jgi:hypothetical protein
MPTALTTQRLDFQARRALRPATAAELGGLGRREVAAAAVVSVRGETFRHSARALGSPDIGAPSPAVDLCAGLT